ncbi:hypothetical protein WJ542_04070 [Paraburkholderia sp. B3]|uniref:hypothetical protein n=1 Tax=Paraburkholderia sp. B3 TaxID=3134791 RepID=UPI003982404D
MTTIVRNTKIPNNPRIVKGQKRRAALDAVTPSVKGLAQRAAVLHAGIATIKAARDVAEKTGNTELAALANNPKLNKAIDAAIKRLGRDAASILRTQLANSNDDPEDLDHTDTANTPTEGDPNAITGQDAAQIRQIRHARFSTAADQAAALGAYNPARVALGLPDEVPDDVYAFIGDVSKDSK